jgi:predicted hydrocarbon binding protein
MSRGFAAGAASVLFKTNVDCIETKCIADGSKFCEFIIQEKKNLKDKKLVKQQLS